MMEALGVPEVYIVFETRAGDAVNGDIMNVYELVLTVSADGWSLRFTDPVYDDGSASDYDDGGFDWYDYVTTTDFDSAVYYTADEIAAMKAEVNERLKTLDIQLRTARLRYEQLEYELSNGVVLAKLDGVVKTVRDADEARSGGEPILLVSGGGGYYVTSSLGEFDRDTMHVGDEVTVQSWQSGGMYTGVITEISEYPDESGSYFYYSEGNRNISTYPFRVFVDEDASLREGEYVSLSYDADAANGDEGGGLYLYMPFVREENGRHVIYVTGDDGLLEKRVVKTGRNLWGSYLEILGGLRETDTIAFPYGRNVKDGARTRVADLAELNGGYYY